MKHYCLIFAFALLTLGGCHSKKQTDQHPKTQIITDFHGKDVAIPINPQRIVSVSPVITEIVFALGEGSKLVGRTDFCQYPPEGISEIPSIGGINNANYETLLALDPDLVITSSIISKEMVEKIEAAHIPVVSLPERKTVDGVLDVVALIGKMLHADAQAKEINDSLRIILKNIPPKDEKHPAPTVYYVVGFGQGGDYSAGKDTYIHHLIELAGGDNIAKEVEGWTYSREKLFEHNPEYIFIREDDFQKFIHTPPYNQLAAVKNRKTFPINGAWMDLQTPRSLNAIPYIYQKIHL